MGRTRADRAREGSLERFSGRKRKRSGEDGDSSSLEGTTLDARWLVRLDLVQVCNLTSDEICSSGWRELLRRNSSGGDSRGLVRARLCRGPRPGTLRIVSRRIKIRNQTLIEERANLVHHVLFSQRGTAMGWQRGGPDQIQNIELSVDHFMRTMLDGCRCASLESVPVYEITVGTCAGAWVSWSERDKVGAALHLRRTGSAPSSSSRLKRDD